MTEAIFPTRRFEAAALVGHGYRLDSAILYDLTADGANRSSCARDVLRDAVRGEKGWYRSAAHRHRQERLSRRRARAVRV